MSASPGRPEEWQSLIAEHACTAHARHLHPPPPAALAARCTYMRRPCAACGRGLHAPRPLTGALLRPPDIAHVPPLAGIRVGPRGDGVRRPPEGWRRAWTCCTTAMMGFTSREALLCLHAPTLCQLLYVRVARPCPSPPTQEFRAGRLLAWESWAGRLRQRRATLAGRNWHRIGATR